MGPNESIVTVKATLTFKAFHYIDNVIVSIMIYCRRDMQEINCTDSSSGGFSYGKLATRASKGRIFCVYIYYTCRTHAACPIVI